MVLLYVENCIHVYMAEYGIWVYIISYYVGYGVEGWQKYIKEEKDQYISARVSANILCEVVWMVLII